MNPVLKKKLNLLVHLARIDGNFHRSEREMILRLVDDLRAIEAVPYNSDPLADIEPTEDRDEILYLSLKLVQADKKVTEEELEFCRSLATKLGFPSGIVDRFVITPVNSLQKFTQELKMFTKDTK